MTEKSYIRDDIPSTEWITAAEEQEWQDTASLAEPVISFKNSYSLIYQPEFYDERRQTVSRLSVRFTESDLPGADLAVEYLREKYLSGMSKHTIRQAGGVLLSFLHFLIKSNTAIFDIIRQDISAFVEHEQDRGLSSISITGYLRALYAFLVYLVERKILPRTILQKKIRLQQPDVLPRAVPSEDVQGLLSTIDNIRDRALILLLLRTGMRIGELLNVKMSDIVLPEKKILIYQGEKNYQGRVVYISEDAEQALKDWLEIRNKKKKYLFYGKKRAKLCYSAAWFLMEKHLEKSGLSHKCYSLHSLRHTFATDMLNAGLRLEVLQQLLGHQSIELTMRYARLADMTRENEYFKAMDIIQQGKHYEPHRVNSQLQAVFEEKKLLQAHDQELPA
jgi:site-specific recombinase XerD